MKSRRFILPRLGRKGKIVRNLALTLAFLGALWVGMGYPLPAEMEFHRLERSSLLRPSEVVARVEKPPETTVPETTVPETTVPETTVPETTVPVTTAPPETTQPPVETTAPVETTTPPTEETAPQPPAPGDAAPTVADAA